MWSYRFSTLVTFLWLGKILSGSDSHHLLGILSFLTGSLHTWILPLWALFWLDNLDEPLICLHFGFSLWKSWMTHISNTALHHGWGWPTSCLVEAPDMTSPSRADGNIRWVHGVTALCDHLRKSHLGEEVKQWATALSCNLEMDSSGKD